MKPYAESALLTDLYEIAMLQGYFASSMRGTAVFEFFVRQLPPNRNFLVAAGLAQLLSYLTGLGFDDSELAWLRESGKFDLAFIASLQGFHFTGDVDAMPEGTVFFADEPVLRVSAPLPEAQFIETRLVNLLHFQTLIASKAVRSVLAAQGRRLIDFGLRRAHGAEAGLLSARASYIAGFDGSATTLAAPLFDIPVFGTMAHSFVQAHESELEAFLAFARAFPANTTLLIDTYDSEAAARLVVRLAHRLEQHENIRINAVRIDSGDLAASASRVRQILDAGNCRDIVIFASGNLDEYALAALVAQQAPIAGFGVGTRMNTSSDAPYLDCAYKLVEYAGRPCRKRSAGKANWPGRKQVLRRYDRHGAMLSDLLTLEGEGASGNPLLRPVMRGGLPLAPPLPLAQVRAYARTCVAALPAALRGLEPAPPYQVAVAESLRELARQVDARQLAQAEADLARWDN
jgi:nicotinate phosphoribosyltransferase